MTYREMKERHHADVNALPIKFAFNKEQFDKACKELGVNDPRKELSRMPSGGFCRKDDCVAIYKTFSRHRKELREAMKDECFAKSAFEYEAWNRELIYSYSPNADMAMAFCYPTKKNGDGYEIIDWDRIENGEQLSGWYDDAIRTYKRKALENV